MVGELNSNIPRMSEAPVSPLASACYYKKYPIIQQVGQNCFVISKVRTFKMELIYFEKIKEHIYIIIFQEFSKTW